jgi:hypothetical protein
MCDQMYDQMYDQLYDKVYDQMNTSRGLRGNQDGEAVGRWHTAAVACACRLRAPAADQCLKKKQLTRTPEPSPRADSSWHPDPLY